MPNIDLFSPAALADPYPVLEELRAAGDVHFLPDQQLYVVLGFEAIRAVLADPQTFSSNLVAVLTAASASASEESATVATAGSVDVLATADPPVHTAHRALVMPQFGPRAVAELTAMIDEAVTPAVAELVAAGGGDWMRMVAHRVPVEVIGQLIGLPREDREQLAAWSDAAIELVSGVATPERAGQATLAAGQFEQYLGESLDHARSASGTKVLGTIAAAIAAGALPLDQGAILLLQLVTAGAESTTSLLGTTVRLLAQDPQLQQSVRSEPGRIGALVEEAVRVESPFRGHFRVTTRPTRLTGVPLDEGARVMLLWGASNRDPRVFEHPECVDLDRAQPTRHHSFGRGIHFCLGAHLARKETIQAVRTLLDTTRAVDLVPGDPAYVPSLIVRRLARLDLRVTPA